MKKEFYFSVYRRNNKKPDFDRRSKLKDGAWGIKKIQTFLLPILLMVLGYSGLMAQCTSYSGGPYSLGQSSCMVGGQVAAAFAAWDNEVYTATVDAGGNYTFDLAGCDQTLWGGPVTITAIGGGTDSGASIDNGTTLGTVTGDCSLTVDIPAGITTVWFTLTSNCGGAVNQVDNGVPTLTTNAGDPCVSGECTSYAGGPYSLGMSSCNVGGQVAAAFAAWDNEVYTAEVDAGGNYTFDLAGCDPNAWGAPLNVTVIGGGTDSGASIDNGTTLGSVTGDCSVTFDVPADVTTVWVTLSSNCGGAVNQLDNGIPTLTTNAGDPCVTGPCESYAGGPYSLGQSSCNIGGQVVAAFNAWDNEVYTATVDAGGNYTFELAGCDQTTWGGPVTITAIGGGTDSGASIDGGVILGSVEGDCSLTFDVPADVSTVWFTLTTNCGGTVNAVDNGLPTLTTNAGEPCATGPCELYDGGPYDMGTSSCIVGGQIDPGFAAWDNEVYTAEVDPGGNYTYELLGCDQTLWGGPITITVIGGGTAAAGEIVGGTIIGSVMGDCSITFDVPDDVSTLWFTATTNCGAPANTIDNGVPTLTTNAGLPCNTGPCTSYAGGPFNIGATSCTAGESVAAGFEAWDNEAYFATLAPDGNYTFELVGCDQTTWGGPFTITVVSGGIAAAGEIIGGTILGSVTGECSITFNAPSDETGVWFVLSTDCGGSVNAVDNGLPTVTTNIAECPTYTIDDTCTVPFNDISGTGTGLGLTDDGTAAISMPFDFTFFGIDYDGPIDMVVGNNGGIVFNTVAGGIPFTNGPLPAGTAPAILPFWDDLDDEVGDVYWEVVGTAPNQQLIVQWHTRPHWPGDTGSDTGTFQVVFNEGSNEINFLYDDVDFGDPNIDNGASATIGIQSGVGVAQYSFNMPSLDGVTCLSLVPFSDDVCGTQFTDMGGANSPYMANENSTTTICPDNDGDAVTVTFLSFDVEQSVFTGNCFDALAVYNGPDATADLIDSFCGNDDQNIPGPITSTDVNSGCLTFVFTSNGSNQGDGWVADISCSELPDCNTSVVVCNDNIQLSLDEDCETPVTPDMVLEGGCANINYSVELFTADGTSIGDVVTSAEVGQVLSAHITHIASGNYCWGTITVEDKLNPTLECPCPIDQPLDNITGELTTEDDTYNRVFIDIFGACVLSGIGTDVYYDALPFSVNAEGVYIFSMMFPGDGTAALYEGSFDPANPCENLLVYNDDGAGNLDPLIISALMSPGDYVLVSSSYGNGDTGEYSWAIDGPGGVLATTGECDYTCLDLDRLLSGDIDAGAPVAADNCGDPVVTFEDEFTPSACDYGIIIRSWLATDGSGNTAACAQEIRLRPLTLEDIIPNGQVDIACDSLGVDVEPTPENLAAAGVEGAYPTIISEGVTYNVTATLCNVGATYEDAPVIDLCGGGYKIIRSWTIYDWCTSTSALYSQVIKVEDNDAPVINTCPTYENVTASTVPNECTGIIVIQDLTDYSENCSNPVTVSVQLTMASGLVVDTQVGAQEQAGVGTHTITYTVTDNCGNASTCETEVTVEDQTPPVAICDEHTTVSLGTDGQAEICWETFNDGSYDNCGPIVIKVKRMDADADVEFTDCVWFDCADVQFDADGNPIPVMVRMRVYDITPDAGFPDDTSGRWNECMVEVEVQDKLNPIISCPPDKTEDCQTAFSEIDGLTDDESLGYPPVYYDGELQGYYANAYDNCIGIVEITDEGELDQCGEGTVYRTWLITDAGGRTDVCTQVITIENQDPFEENDIDWPRDATVDCGDGTEPDDLPNGRQRPEFDEDTCDLVAVTYEDQYLPVVDSACYKILRTWTVIDWCQFDGVGNGIWTNIQVIKVRDEDAPELTQLDDVTVCTFTDDCVEVLELSVDATDECSDELTYHLFIDGYADGNVETTASIGLSEGTHTIIWTVSDGCNNSETMQYDITIEDCKQPTPVCINGLATVIMPSSGAITLWDSDFNAPGNSGSFDNCTPQDELRYRIRKVSPDNTVLGTIEEVLALGHDVTFTCDDLGFPNVELYVIDNNDNWDYCTTYVSIADNDGICIDPTNELAAIEGHVGTEYEEMIENVAVNIFGGPEMVESTTTDAAGFYHVEVPMGNNYTVELEKNDNYLNGVTTFDLVLISQHILGIQLLDSPYKIVASDANASNSVTTLDLVLLRKLILNEIQELPNNTSWRFIDKDYVFPNATNPFMTIFPEVIAFNDIDQDELATDFVGVKVGDVNGTAIPNTLLGVQDRTRENDLLFVVDENNLKAGQEYTVDFTAKDFEDMLGYQFTLNFDQNMVEVLDVVPGNLKNLSTTNFGMSMLDEGIVTASWNDATVAALKDDAVVFSVRLNALTDTKVSNVFAISSKFTAAEAYNTTEEMGIAIAFNAENGIEVAGNVFELYQNKPNPFNNSTTIGFSLPNAENATLSIYDVTGKVLRTYSADFGKGYNEIVVNRAELSSAGMLYYKLETSEKIATKKMIILE